MSEQEVTAAVITDFGCVVIGKIFEQYEDLSIDDSDFAPLVRCVGDAAEAHLIDKGVSKAAAARARKTLLDIAVQIYVRLCKEHVPEEANAKEDTENFLYLMKHGRWPGE